MLKLTALPEGAEAADTMVDAAMPLQHLLHKCGAARFSGQVGNQGVQASGGDACAAAGGREGAAGGSECCGERPGQR